jgi:four helix bundle protein
MRLVARLGVTQHKRMSTRTREFHCAVIDEYRRIAPQDDVEMALWRDLLKTVRSVANNGAESGGAQSRQDFIQKFHICLKEGMECQQLLAALMHASPSRALDLQRLRQECDVIVAILVTSLKTAKANQETKTKPGR